MSRLLITGGHGFLGRAVCAEFLANSSVYRDIVTFRSAQYDLRDRGAVQRLLADERPDAILHLAATVGGIGANMKYPATFLYENLIMGTQLIEEARLHGVGKFVLAGTICSYPKHTPVPFREEDLWLGYPEETNAPYGLAKKLLMVQLEAYRKQYGFQGVSLLPVNLYGPGDNFDLENSHVIPAMIRKFHQAKLRADTSVTLWGDGTPSREFLYVDDAARALRLATESYSGSEPVNIGSGQEVTMTRLAELVRKVVGFEGTVHWDSTRPNGQPRRCLDVSKAEKLFGFRANITLPMGLDMTYRWFCDHAEALEASSSHSATTGKHAAR